MAQPNATLVLTRLPKLREGYCTGPAGCGQCADCKRNARRATAKVLDCDRPYLGLKSFASLFPAPRWLECGHDSHLGYSAAQPDVNYWPKTRLAIRRALLAEVLSSLRGLT